MYINISSADRIPNLSDSSSDFTILFSMPIKNVTNVSLTSVTLPNTIYKISYKNNLFVWTSNSTTHQIVIPSGAYTIYNLLSYIQQQINAIDANSYQLSYNPTTFYATISGTSAFMINFATSNTCYKELGFLNIDTPSNTTFTSTNAIQLYQPQSLFINISELGAVNMSSSKFQYTFKIPVQVNSQSIINFDQNSFFTQKITYSDAQNYNQFTIQLLDINNQIVNLNGSDWELLLECS